MEMAVAGQGSAVQVRQVVTIGRSSSWPVLNLDFVLPVANPGSIQAPGSAGAAPSATAFSSSSRCGWVKVSITGLTETNRDLDRILERDGILYGIEVKDQLGQVGARLRETNAPAA
jgi:hypothetical protein